LEDAGIKLGSVAADVLVALGEPCWPALLSSTGSQQSEMADPRLDPGPADLLATSRLNFLLRMVRRTNRIILLDTCRPTGRPMPWRLRAWRTPPCWSPGRATTVAANLVFGISHETLHLGHVWVLYATVWAALSSCRNGIEPPSSIWH
jgi:hypothetical protein